MVIYNSGIEHAELQRARLFQHYHQPHAILLDDRNLSGHLIAHQIGLSDSAYLNMYDYYQHAQEVPSHPFTFQQLTIRPGSKIIKYANCTVIKRSNQAAWIHYHWFQHHRLPSIERINYLRNGKCYEIRYYDSRGFLSHRLFFTHRHLHSYFYSPSGQVMLKRVAPQKPNQQPLYYVCGYHQPLRGHYGLIQHFYNTLCRAHQSDASPVIFIADRWWRNQKTARLIRDIRYPHYTVLDMHFAQNNNLREIHNPKTQDVVAKLTQQSWNQSPDTTYDAIICSTDRQCQGLQHNYRIRRPLFTVPVGVSSRPSHRVPINQRLPYQISCVTRICSAENIPGIIQAFGLAKQRLPKLQLSIYGKMGPFSRHFRHQLAVWKHLYQLTGHLKIHQYTFRGLQIYQNSQLTITAAPRDAFNISLLNALSRGCPGITYTNSYGPCEMIRNGYDGYQVAPRPRAMADAIVKYFTSPQREQRFSDHAYQMATHYAPWRVWKKWQVVKQAACRKIIR